MTHRRLAAGIAVAALAAGALTLTACSSSSDTPSNSSSAPSSPSAIGGDTLPPVVIEPGQTTATAKVGDALYFNVPEPGNWTISTSDSQIVSVTPGGTVDGAETVPGGKALAPGTANITLENTNGEEGLVVAVTVTSDNGEPMASMTPPIMVEPGQTTATAPVGKTITFNVPEPSNWTISTSDSQIVSVTPGGTVDGVTSVPAGQALAAGTSTITLENTIGKEAWVVTVTVTP